MLNVPSTLNWPEPSGPGKRPNLQLCIRAAGLPHTVSVSPKLTVRCGWIEPPPAGVDPHVIAWVVRLVLTGHWPHRVRQTQYGEVFLVEFPAFISDKEAIDLTLGIVVGNNRLDLLDPEELDQPRPKRACVLAAEDELELARLLCAMLEREGFVLVHAPDGLEAWRLLQNQYFDVVVLDVDMPGLSGLEVCRRIRAAPMLAHLPVILCSGRTDLAELTAQIGADDYVEKPAGLLQLAERINRLLGLRGLRPKPDGDQ